VKSLWFYIGSLSEEATCFGLLLFERMLPSLIAFSKDTGFDHSCYLRAKDAAWSAHRTALSTRR